MNNLTELTTAEWEEFYKYEELIKYVSHVTVKPQYLAVHLLDYTDIEHYALIGLIKGIQTYDENQAVKKRTHYINSIKWEIGKGIRKDSLRLPEQNAEEAIFITSLNIPTGEDGEDSLMDILSDDDDKYSDTEIDYNYLSKVDELLPTVVSMLASGHTRTSIEKKMGWGRHTVSRLIKKHKEEILQSLGVVELC